MSKNKTEWTTGTVTLTVNATDTQSGLSRDDGSYSFDNGASWQTSNQKTYSANTGTIYIKVRDGVGNTSSTTASVTNIDTTPPGNISVSYDDSSWTKSKTITASATDSQAGINAADGYGWSSDNVNYTWQGNTYTVTNPGTYYLKVRDSLGNESTVKSFSVTKVDNKAPAITNVTQSGWSQNSVTLTVTAQDLQANGAAGSGIAGYKFTDGGTWQTGNTWTTSQNGTVNIYVKDNTGRVSAVYQFNVSHIDTTAPSVTVTKTVGSSSKALNDTAWSNQQTTVTIAATDGQSGPSAYSIDGGSTWTGWPKTGSTPASSVTLTYDTNTETVLSIKVRDAVLNTSAAQQVTVKVDKSLPSITSVDQTPEAAYPWVTVNGVKWTGGNIKLTVNATDVGGSGLAAAAYSFNDGAWQSIPEYTMVANGPVKVKVLDDAGNIYTQNVRVTAIDKSIPQEPSFTWDSVNWTNTDKTVTIGTIIDDGGSGIGSVVVKYGETILTTRSSGSNVIFDAPQNGTYTVIITDNVGNTRTTPVTISKIDKTPPSARVDGNPTAWQNTDAHLTIVASDLPAGDNNGLDASPYSWDNGAHWTNDPNLTVSQNQTLHVIVRDSVGNETPIEVNVEYVDEVKPEDFTIAGNPTEWTKDDVILTIPDARDTLSGLAEAPYNWGDGTGYTSLNTYTVTENKTVSVTVSDAVGNTKTQSVTVNKIDKTAPSSVYITGNPTEWTQGPVTITAHATDTQSGIKEYSWDNGATWQASQEHLYYENQAVTLLVKDKVGNISDPYAFDITRVDTTPPSLSVVMTAATADRKGVITQLYATDYGAPGPLLYAWDYDPVANTGTWGTIIQAVLKSGQDYTIACKDPVGNISYQTVKPKAYEMPNGGGNVPMFSQSTLDCAGYILGKTAYMDQNGTVSKYEDAPLAVTVRAEPQYGGWMVGYATIGSTKYPITWDAAGTLTATQESATGTFIITPDSFTTTKKNTELTVHLAEYEDDTLATRINQDTMTVNVTIDVTAPITSISLYADTVTIASRDTIAGIASIEYRMQGTEDWNEYTAPFELPASGILEVRARDNVENESTTSSTYITKDSGTGGTGSHIEPGTSSAEYRSYWFNYYLIGTPESESWR